MARSARVCSQDIAHHVTRRGNARQTVFYSDHGRRVYLNLLRANCRLQQLSVLGYRLLPNPVHLWSPKRRNRSRLRSNTPTAATPHTTTPASPHRAVFGRAGITPVQRRRRPRRA